MFQTKAFKRLFKIFAPNHSGGSKKIEGSGIKRLQDLKSESTLSDLESEQDITSESEEEYEYDEYPEENEERMVINIEDPVQFSEDPVIRSNEMMSLAEELFEQAMYNVSENDEILEASQIQHLMNMKESVDTMREKMQLLDTDTPTARLLKASVFISDVGVFLRRAIFMVVGIVGRSPVSGVVTNSIVRNLQNPWSKKRRSLTKLKRAGQGDRAEYLLADYFY
ncbi:hypothetical protein B0H34DRAFT_672793 [Crassisporium funariophilum]|nr:hypothetical protein B0H34DRAFT_672793 [Crassisporium funariophilum]